LIYKKRPGNNFSGDGGAVLVNGNTYLQNNGNGYTNQIASSNGYTNQIASSNGYTNQIASSNGYTNQMGISNGYINPDVIPIQLQQRPPSREETLEKGVFLGMYIT
jgi:hypothetical protein